MAADFQAGAGGGRGLQDGFHVDGRHLRVGRLAPRRQRQNVNERVLHGPAQTAGQFAPLFFEAGAGGGDHHVARPQQLSGSQGVAVGRKVDFHAGQQAKIVRQGGVHQFDGRNLLLKFAGVKPAARGGRVGGVANGDVLVAHFPSSLGDLIQAVGAVSPMAADAKIAQHVLLRYQPRQFVRLRGLDFPAALAQFRGNERQSQQFVQGCLFLHRSVFSEAPAVKLSPLLQRRHVGAGPRAHQQSAGKLRRRHGGKRDAQALGEKHHRRGWPAVENLCYFRLAAAISNQALGVLGAHDDVDVPHQGAAAADAAGNFNPLNGRKFGEVVHQGLGACPGDAEQHAIFVPLPSHEVATQDGKRGCIQGRLVGSVGLGELVQRGDAVLSPQRANLLDRQAGKAQQGRQALGHCALQMVVITQPAGVEEFVDFAGKCLSNAGNGFKPAAPCDGLQALVDGQNRLRGASIGADTKRIVPPQFQQIGDVVEDGADGPLIHDIAHSSRPACRRCQNATTLPTTSSDGGVSSEAATASPICDSGAVSSA